MADLLEAIIREFIVVRFTLYLIEANVGVSRLCHTSETAILIVVSSSEHRFVFLL